METNFTMKTHKLHKDIHIDLQGTFDGASAFALLNCIEKECRNGDGCVYIETKGVSRVYPFGRIILDSRLPRYYRRNVFFTGERASDIAPEGCPLLSGHPHRHGHKCSGKCKNCRCRKEKQKEMLN